MRNIDGLALFEKVVFGWLPREPGAASGRSKKQPMSLKGRLASFFVFEFLVVLVVLEALQLAGLGSDSSFTAGIVGGVAGAAGSVLFLKGVERKRLPAGVDRLPEEAG